jgi:hypothetical protein
MPAPKDLHQKIAAFHNRAVADPHHRYRSWEYCYRFFRARTPAALIADKDAAALQLGFYLASWGMYRGSSFLLQRSYTVHIGVVERLALGKFSTLWSAEIGAGASDVKLIPTLLAAVEELRMAYKPFGDASDTLATKVLLGTLGCLPACDRFFIDGFKKSGQKYSYLNARFVERVIGFCTECGDELRREQARIDKLAGMRYPLMKLADMYFWQIGYEIALGQAIGDAEFSIDTLAHGS